MDEKIPPKFGDGEVGDIIEFDLDIDSGMFHIHHIRSGCKAYAKLKGNEFRPFIGVYYVN